MRINRVIISLLLISTGFVTIAQPKAIAEKNGIKIFEGVPDHTFDKAEIALVSPLNNAVMHPGKDTLIFEVKNYNLGAQTADADQKMCANSAKGQHIHFILDNQPYQASYATNIPAEVKPGHHVLLAFLSRSYHESIKSKAAYLLREFNGGALSEDNFNEKAPHIFYSRPKGDYIGEKETKRVLLDFYLLNCQLSAKGYRVKVTINGTEFMLSKWLPYYVEGLPLGENKIKLELIDKSGNPVSSPFNGTQRSFNLKEEPLRN